MHDNIDQNFKSKISKLVNNFSMTQLASSIFLKEAEKVLKQNNLYNLTDSEIFKLVLTIFNCSFFTSIDSLETVLTEQCNLKCDYCFIKKKSKNAFTIERVKQVLDFLVLYSGNEKELHFTLLGGEPLLEFETIFQLIGYSDQVSLKTGKLIHFDATTNGVLLSEEILSKGNSKVKYLLSIDGDEKTHNKHRKFLNSKGSFHDVISKIELLRKYQPWIGTRMTICPDTVSDLSRNVEFLYNNGINQFLLGICYGPKWPEKSLRIYEEELIKISDYYSKRIRNNDPFRITYFEKQEDKTDCLSGIWGCRAGRNNVTVLQNGDIYPCSKFVGLESFDCDEFKLGNIFDGITNLCMREKLFTMENKDFKKCSYCDESKSCVGGCIAENYNQNRSIFTPCKDQCEITKINNRVLRRFWAEQEQVNQGVAL